MKISLRQKLINIIFIIALLILTYSGNSESNHREIKADQSSDTGLTGSIDVNRSMKYIFKNYDSNTRVSIWNNVDIPQNMNDNNVFTKNKNGKVSKVLSHLFVINNVEKYLLITKTVPVQGDFRCRFCAPLINGFLFVKKDNRWVIESQNYYIGFYGRNGEAPNTQMVHVGVNKIGVIFDSQEMHGGIPFTTAALIGQVGRTMLELINFDIRRDNIYQAEKHYSYETKYEFYPENDKQYFNMKLITAGTKKKMTR